MDIYKLCRDTSPDIADAARRAEIPDLEAIAEEERKLTERFGSARRGASLASIDVLERCRVGLV